MELADYARILRRRGWIIVVVAAVAALSALGFSRLQPRIYKSSMQMTVLPARNDMGLAQTTKSLLRAYVTIMYTKKWAGQVLDRISPPLDMTPDQLMSNVTIASYEDRNVIQIDVKDRDGEQANRISLTWAQEFQAWREAENGKVRKEDQVEVILGDNPTYTQYRPQTKINVAAGGIFGLLLGALIVAGLEWVESGLVRTPADVERKLGLSVVGTIPDGQSALVALQDPRSPAAEAYRKLRTSLAMGRHEMPHTLVVTSTTPGENKSVTLVNLAIAIAQGRQRVVLVDADLRRPGLHELLGAPNECGLTTLLEDPRGLAAPALVATSVDHLQLLPSGPLPLDPSALLGSRLTKEIIAALQQHADVILFDAPPLLAAADAAVLGQQVDGVLLVAQTGRTGLEQARQAQEILRKAQACILGVALVDAHTASSRAGYYGTNHLNKEKS